MTCALCGRPFGRTIEKHHLVPRSRGGKEQVPLHPICHVKIHSVFTEKELEEYFNTFARLRENDHIRAFVKWVAKKPPDFYEKSKDEVTRRKKRRRR